MNIMNAIKRNAMLYRAVKGDYNVNFEKSYYEQNYTALQVLSDWAEIANIKPRTGWTPARTLYHRLKDYEVNHMRSI